MDLRDLLRRKAHTYQRVFAGRDGERVLADLARFCHAQRTTHVPGDPYGSAQLEGRRQVWLRLQEALALTDAQINRMQFETEDDE